MRGLKPTLKTAAATALFAALVVPPQASAVEPVLAPGTLSGQVSSGAGVPQMGAAVLLFNRFERMIDRAVTDEKGAFRFASLQPELYTIRVTLASFVPALKRDIVVQPGMQSFLAINLTSLISSVELVYTGSGPHPIMSDEWKWVLRSAGATSPVLRLVDTTVASGSGSRSWFSDTRGLFSISAGGSGELAAVGNQADLGTAFSLATSLFGTHQLQFSGNLGYASHAGIPTAGFRTTFSPSAKGERGPEVSLTMRQLFMPSRPAASLGSGPGDSLPALQTFATSFKDRRRLMDDVELEYGSTLESVSFLNRLNYASPFARLRWGTVEEGALEFAFSSGAPAVELLDDPSLSQAELSHDLASLSLFPRVSLRGGNAHIERTQNAEIGYRRSVGSSTVSLAVWEESVSNAAFTMSGSSNFFASTELMPDLASNSSVFNAGSYHRNGYSASFTQKLGDELSVTGVYGYATALTAEAPELGVGNDPDELRSLLHRGRRHSLTTRVNGTAPYLGTRFTATYQWTDHEALQPVHLSLTQRATFEPGLNISLHQPIPGTGGMLPGRLEASAELRNLLADGYLPIRASDGSRLMLIPSPRAIRGGLSFIF